MQHQVSPREIQTRIRSGATLQQVAAEYGCDPARIEPYAYPVLMERSAMADRAKSARPIVGGVELASSVAELVQRTLTDRGQHQSIAWDAYRTDSGPWVLQVSWAVGHSENTARWHFQPSARGGSLSPLDEVAAEIVDPTPKPLRTVPESATADEPAPEHPMLVQQPPALPATTPPATTPVQQPAPPARAGNRVAAALAHHAVGVPGTARPAPAPRRPIAKTGTENPAGRGQRAPMPSWEDVLLGGQ